MIFTVENDEYVVLDDESSREILFDELMLLTNSKRLINLLQNNIGEQFIFYRTNSKYDSHKRLVLMHQKFKKGCFYYNIHDSKRYRCLGYDVNKNEAILRRMTNERKIKLSNNIKEWAIIA